MFYRIAPCLFAMGLALAAAVAPAATYNVNPRTIADAIALLEPGDTMILADGQYEALRLSGLSGTAELPITIKAANERMAYIQADGAGPGLALANCSHVHVIGLRVHNMDNEDNRDTSNAGIVHLAGSDHCVVRRVLAANTNRWGNNTGISVAGGTNNCLIEENELYDFHRNGLSVHNAPGRTHTRDNILRRNYINSRGTDYLGRRWGPNDAVVLYRGFRNVVENNIGEFTDAEGHSFGVWGAENRLLGNIAIGARSGFPIVQGWTARSGQADSVVLQDNLGFESRGTAFYTNSVRDVIFRNNTSFDSGGTGLTLHNARGHLRGEGFQPSVRVMNHLSIGGRIGYSIQHLEDFSQVSIEGSYGWNNQEAAWGAGTDGVERNEDVDPRLDDSPIYIPEGSPMRGRGVDGADVGATILYRYEAGVLTDEPLWCRETGAFPHGAVIQGVNDQAGRSLFDVHERLGVTPELLRRAYGE